MELAIADLQSQEKPNYRATAKKHGVNNVTLRRRFLGEQLSPTAAASLYRQRLSAVQEVALIDQINRLTDRGLPPTSCITRHKHNPLNPLVNKPLNPPEPVNRTGPVLVNKPKPKPE
jgi:hypothetical protein